MCLLSMNWTLAISLYSAALFFASSHSQHFKLSCDERIWWSCGLAATDCLGEFLRKMSHLLSLAECKQRVHYLPANNRNEMHDIQYVAYNRMHHRTAIDDHLLYVKSGNQTSGPSQQRFTPLMEVLANVALQKAEACFVDTFVIRELMALVHSKATALVPASHSPPQAFAGRPAGPPPPSEPKAELNPYAAASGSVNLPVTVDQATAINPPGQSSLPTGQSDSCRLPPNVTAMIQEGHGRLKRHNQRIEDELGEYKEIVVGYEQMGRVGRRKTSQYGGHEGGYEPDGYGQQQQRQQAIPRGLALQFRRLAGELKKRIDVIERTKIENNSRMQEYESIMNSSGCTINSALQAGSPNSSIAHATAENSTATDGNVFGSRDPAVG